MDDAAWAALALSLTVLGGIWTWMAFRRRGLLSGMRALGFTLLPLAAYLTKTLRMLTEIADAIGSWATRLVFSPTFWLGAVLGGLGIVLIVVSSSLRARRPDAVGTKPSKPSKKERSAPEVTAAGKRPAPAIDSDPDMDEIEALLRKRGIN